MTPLNRDRAAFGRHETFPLRFGWLTKGFNAWCEDQALFDDDDATVKLGVGKNMVDAIRYWMFAAQVVTNNGKSQIPTPIGRKIFGRAGWDPYLEDDATIWLIHWLIASNPKEATTPFWFFNRFHKPEFTTKELYDALADFVRENLASKVSPSTLKHDVTLLLRMYAPSHATKSIPLEEALDSPLSMLGLVHHQEGGRAHESRPEHRSNLPIAVLSYSTADYFDALGVSSLPIDRLVHSDGLWAAPGSVFRLSEECLVAKLEEMIAWLPEAYALRESAGIHQLFRLQRITPEAILRRYYERSHSERGVDESV